LWIFSFENSLSCACAPKTGGLAVARLRQGNGVALAEGSSALTWAVVFLVIDLFLGLSVGALGFTQARCCPAASQWLPLGRTNQSACMQTR
jgi:hypothetical protein